MSEQLSLPACLIIMDGFGLEDAGPGNAISLAKTPVLDELFKKQSMTSLIASGEEVGLPNGQMGNSEVGHLNIGAGRVVHQELTRINKACECGSLNTNPILKETFFNIASSEAHDNDVTLHLMGLLSDGGVHSNNKHLYALIDSAATAGVKKIHIHCFLDGRDVAPTSGINYIRELIDEISSFEEKYPNANIAISTITGRYYAMDRDNRWDRVERAYNAIANGAPISNSEPINYVEKSYTDDITDEFVLPASFDGRGVKDGDAIVFFNFRPDRAREISHAFTDIAFDNFSRGERKNITFVCLTEYDPTLDSLVAFPKEFPDNVLADVISDAGLSQYHIAETEKYAHVTFFLNGGIEESKKGETRKLIDSPKVATYDLQPEMSAPEVASALASAIKNNEADVYIVNFANCDMVGHTGIVEAAKAAVEAVDNAVGEVLSAMKEVNGTSLLTADHGNADCMIAENGSAHTAHTTAPVPLVLIDDSGRNLALSDEVGKLADIAPTLLDIIGLDIPEEMTGKSLLAR